MPTLPRAIADHVHCCDSSDGRVCAVPGPCSDAPTKLLAPRGGQCWRDLLTALERPHNPKLAAREDGHETLAPGPPHATMANAAAVAPREGRMAGAVCDLASLTNLNEDILVRELEARYNRDDIYVSAEGGNAGAVEPHLSCQPHHPPPATHRLPTFRSGMHVLAGARPTLPSSQPRSLLSLPPCCTSVTDVHRGHPHCDQPVSPADHLLRRAPAALRTLQEV